MAVEARIIDKTANMFGLEAENQYNVRGEALI
jgi:hypothetical protein